MALILKTGFKIFIPYTWNGKVLLSDQPLDKKAVRMTALIASSGDNEVICYEVICFWPVHAVDQMIIDT